MRNYKKKVPYQSNFYIFTSTHILHLKELVSQKVLGRDADHELHVLFDYALAGQA